MGSQQFRGGGGLVPQPQAAAVQAVHDESRSAEAVALARARCELAIMQPRDEDRAEKRALKAMQDPLQAERATWRFPRGNEELTGPSVRLAREIARVWGHIDSGTKVLSQDDREVHIEGFAWDLESGRRVTKQARFNKKIPRKDGQGNTYWKEPNERDLDELIARRGAKLERNAILELIPDGIIDRCLHEAERTRREGARELDPMVAFTKAAGAFERFGVTKDQLLEYVGEVSTESVMRLREVFQSILQGNAEPSEFFAKGDGPKEEKASEPTQERPETLDDLWGKSE